MSILIEKIKKYGGTNLAHEIGVTKGAVCHVVKGRRKFSKDNAAKVAKALNIDIKEVRP